MNKTVILSLCLICTLMTMAFKYFSYNGIKENFWGNFPYSTRKETSCEPQFLYTVPGDMSSAMGLYPRGGDITHGMGFMGNTPQSVLEVGERTPGNVGKTSVLGSESFQQPSGNMQRTVLDNNDLREDFSCIKPGNHLQNNMYGPLKAYDYGNKDVNSGEVPENPVTGPVVCRERIMYSTGRTKTSAARNWLVGDNAISSRGIVSTSQYSNNLLNVGAVGSVGNNLVKNAGVVSGMNAVNSGDLFRQHATASGARR